MPEYDKPDATSEQSGLSPTTRVRLGLFETPLLNPRASLRDADWQIRAQALIELARTGKQARLRDIIARLADQHELVRAAAIRALGILAANSKDKVPIAQVVDAWQDRSSDVRIAVLDVLAEVASQHLSPSIISKALSEREDEEVRLAALYATARLGNQAPIERLVELLRYDPSWRIREEAVRALVALGKLVSDDFFFDALFDRSEIVILCAIRALQQHHSMEYLVQWLLDSLHDHAIPLRAGAASILGILREQQVRVPIEQLLEVVRNDPSRVVRKTALFALGRPGEQPPKEQLIQAVEQEPDGNLRFVAWCILETWYPVTAAHIRIPTFLPMAESTQGYFDYVLHETSLHNEGTPREDQVFRNRWHGDQQDQVFIIQESDRSLENFRAQSIAYTRLHHPHILPLLDFGVRGDRPYWVLPYIRGDNLRQRYDAGEKFPIETVLTYITQLANALSYAHERYILHLDIKPENILFNEKREILLSGFQIADHLYRPHSPYSQPDGSELASPQTDQYSLAALLYEWLTGHIPPKAGVHNGHGDRWHSVGFYNHALNPALSTEIDRVLKKALSPQDSARYPDIQKFIEELTMAIHPS